MKQYSAPADGKLLENKMCKVCSGTGWQEIAVCKDSKRFDVRHNVECFFCHGVGLEMRPKAKLPLMK